MPNGRNGTATQFSALPIVPRHRPLSFANAKVVPLVGLTWTIVQGVEPGIWKWTVRLDEKTVRSGIDKTRAAAVSAVERLIDRALAPNKVGLPPADKRPVGFSRSFVFSFRI